MPIEIRELNIKMTVGGNQKEEDSAPTPGTATPAPDKDEIISECVEQVMELLRAKIER